MKNYRDERENSFKRAYRVIVYRGGYRFGSFIVSDYSIVEVIARYPNASAIEKLVY